MRRGHRVKIVKVEVLVGGIEIEIETETGTEIEIVFENARGGTMGTGMRRGLVGEEMVEVVVFAIEFAVAVAVAETEE